MESEDQKKLHIAIFPWLAYRHLMSLLEVSKFLAQKGHQISFISTPKNINGLRSSSFSPLIDFVELPLPAVDSVAKLIRRVMVDKEGESIRSNAWAMKEIFGKVELNNMCLDEFTRVLETWPTFT